MESNIQIVEKPDWVSWDDIHKVLWEAHADNREKGIWMRYPSLSGEEIRLRVEGKGKMFCAIKDGKLVGSAALVSKNTRLWFDESKTTYAYLCFTGVLPECAGQGVYKHLYGCVEREKEKLGLTHIMFDTHEKNCRMLEINAKNGFFPVDYKFCKDHFNIVMANWPKECPYSKVRIRYEFEKRKLRVKIKHLLLFFESKM